MICPLCKKREKYKNNSYCKECQKIKNKKYYEKNKKSIIKRVSDRSKKLGYAYEKTTIRRKDSNIRRTTRFHYPLTDKECLFCKNKAEHHHHTTNPIVYNKFIYVCRKCHNKIHNGTLKLLQGGENGKTNKNN